MLSTITDARTHSHIPAHTRCELGSCLSEWTVGGSPFDQGSQAAGVLPPDNDDDDGGGGGDSPTGEGPGGLVPGSLLPVKDYVGSVDTSDFDIVRGIHTLVACVLRIRCRAKCGWVRKWNCFLAECVRALLFVVANMLVFTPASLISLLLKKLRNGRS